MSSSARAVAEELLAKADIKINGERPWDMTVHNESVFGRILGQGTLGLGESYMDGWWDVPALDQFISKALRAHLERYVRTSLPALITIAKAWLFNLQTRSRAYQVGEAHYDIGNDLYDAMLDKRMVYTCGYWKDAHDLDTAQEAKLDLVCRKIGLKKGDRVLDIGCGWGSFAKFAAERYGASVVGITISKEQAILAREICKGLPIEIRVQDYREVNEMFDHIISIGMFEHVGVKNYGEYFKMAHRCLKEDGKFLLHSIGSNRSVLSTNPWTGKYIFPNGVLPSIAQIGKAIEGLFVMEDWHNFGADYDKTLMAWFANFDAAWPQLREKYGDRFYRMWKFYLLMCAGAFRARYIQLWQIVLTKDGVPGGYVSVR
jgi:cyclopropane-fatty-acyl-phospholipid synthase